MLAEDKDSWVRVKDFLTYGIPSSISFLFALLLKLHAGKEELKWMLHTQQVYIQLRNLKLR